EEFAVFLCRHAHAAYRSAVNAGAGYSDEKYAVETRIPRLHGGITLFGLQLHGVECALSVAACLAVFGHGYRQVLALAHVMLAGVRSGQRAERNAIDLSDNPWRGDQDACNSA